MLETIIIQLINSENSRILSSIITGNKKIDVIEINDVLLTVTTIIQNDDNSYILSALFQQK